MSKKWAILLVLLGESLIYLFLLVGLPMFAEELYSCTTCTWGRDNLGSPWFLYSVPGLFGVWFIWLIITQKKEAKDE